MFSISIPHRFFLITQEKTKQEVRRAAGGRLTSKRAADCLFFPQQKEEIHS